MFSSKWDERFMRLAHHFGEWSKDRGRRFGSVIVGPDREIRSTGYNGIPRGVNDDVEERHSSKDGAKYIWAAHAESNAIFNAARMGTSVQGCVIYVPMFPCADCAKAIIQSGISELVTYRPDTKEAVWGVSFEASRTMLEEAGMRIKFLEQIEPILMGEGSKG